MELVNNAPIFLALFVNIFQKRNWFKKYIGLQVSGRHKVFELFLQRWA